MYVKIQGNFFSEREKEFFEELICKELYDFPCSSFDVLVHENSNAEKIYIQKQYNSEYVVGRFKEEGEPVVFDDVAVGLAELLGFNLFPLLNRHITVLEWLRRQDYQCVRYDYPWEE